MKPKQKLKIAIDISMTALLFCQMAYMLISEAAHEWTGIAMFLSFLLHQILNRGWYKNLAKGKYRPARILQTVVNFLLLLSMLSLMTSGIILSREVFTFLPISRGMGLARILHMLASYWGFILMSIHLGLHWGMILGIVRKASGVSYSRTRAWVLRGLALLLSGFGVYVFLKHNIADYLFLRSQFVFFDMEQPLALFFAEYLAMMCLWSCIGYYVGRLLQKIPAGIRYRKIDTENSG